MMHFCRNAIVVFGFLLIGLSLGWGHGATVFADNPVVRAVLFFSPYCGHCHKVIEEDLPPLLKKYGNRLQIIGIDVSQESGNALYMEAVERFNLYDQLGVPTLIVGDWVLIGSADIPEQFPALIERYLAQGGVAWPNIPSLERVMTATQPTPTATATRIFASPHPPTPVVSASTIQTPSVSPQAPTIPGLILPESSTPSPVARIMRDPVGNGLAIVTLTGMLLVVVSTVLDWLRKRTPSQPNKFPEWLMPTLALIGLGVAAYLAYVEMTQVTAVCGPVGDCNAVQQSEYARLFGVMPIGVLGMVGYILILSAWAVAQFSRHPWTRYARLALLAMTFLGTLFSIYLTLLEPFVIGATCAWCLTSAIVMTILLWSTRTVQGEIVR